MIHKCLAINSAIFKRSSTTMSKILPYDIVIIGGGLSGLVVAQQINSINTTINPKKSWMLLEARSKLGGRLENDTMGHEIDLGGAWIWPQHQPHIRNLVKNLGIETFTQPDDDDGSSTRIQGGAAEIVNRIAKTLPSENIRTSSPVLSCSRRVVTIQTTNNINNNESLAANHVVTIKLESGEEIEARRVVLAAPPKLIAKHIEFDPPLSTAKTRAMYQSQTWMAGVTKVALVYKEPRFWPLSISNRGFRPGPPNQPAFQVYDSSPHDDKNTSLVSALTFFTLASISNAADDDNATLARHCAEQMVDHLVSNSRGDNVPRTVIDKLKEYDDFHVKRWPMEKYISEEKSPRAINPHPEPTPELAKSEWGGQLLFAGTEADLSSPGVMEGAVVAAIRVVDELQNIDEE